MAAKLPSWQEMTDEQAGRWTQVLHALAASVPPGPTSIVIDDTDGHAAIVADRLAATLRAAGRPCTRLAQLSAAAAADTWRTEGSLVVADGPRWRGAPPHGGWDVDVWLRTASTPGSHHCVDGEHDATVVLDLRDPCWPIIKRMHPRLIDDDRWHLAETRAFFGRKAATWDSKFGDDLPAYAAAVAEADIPPGAVALDVGCGSGRALPALRAAIGAGPLVIGLDVTPQMLIAATRSGRAAGAVLMLADAQRLPMAAGSVDAVFAAGLINHLPDTVRGLAELARVTRAGGRLVLFHPSGRAALAARHGQQLRPDDALAQDPLRIALDAAGWQLVSYDDPPHRFFALARRRPTGYAVGS